MLEEYYLNFLCYSQCDTDMTHVYVHLHFYFLYHFPKSAQSNQSSKSSLHLSYLLISSLFFWASKSPQMLIAPMKLKDAYSWKESYDQPR